jgi:antirestriction protein ArdC
LAILRRWRRLKDSESRAEGQGGAPFVLRYYSVFNTEQCALPEERTMDPIEACEKLSAEMPNPPEIEHAGDKAFYSPMTALQESVLKGGTLQRRIRAPPFQ